MILKAAQFERLFFFYILIFVQILNMANIWRRLKYYGIGFGIGCVFVFFFFQNRGCSWLPSNRVKNAIMDRVIVVSDSVSELLEEKGLSDDDLIQVLNDGDVLFGESDKDNDSKVYVIEKDGAKFLFTLPHESFVSEVYIGGKAKSIETSTSGKGRLIHFPLDDNLVFPDSSRLVTCQQEMLGLVEPKKILKLLKNSGRIDFDKTDLEITPKPEHFLTVINKADTIGMKVIWYKNKLNVTSFQFEGSDECEE